MTWTALLVFAVVVLASRCDSLRDRHFDPERLTRWRQPFILLGTDPWHLVKWAGLYPPLALCCFFGYGAPWSGWAATGLWSATTAGAWVVWGWGSPWPSFWMRLLRRK